MTTTFREATPDDSAAILALYEQLHPNDPPAEPEAAATGFEAIFGSDVLHLLVLEDEGRVVATTYLNIIPNLTRGPAPYAVVENVVVEESLRGTGLGKRLMAETLALAWKHGCYKATLQTGSRRESTHGFYRACGFSPDEKTAYLARPPKATA